MQLGLFQPLGNLTTYDSACYEKIMTSFNYIILEQSIFIDQDLN